MSFRIVGLGTAVPDHVMTQEESAALGRQVICRTDQQARVLSALYHKAGVNKRHTALPHRLALDWLPPSTGDSAEHPPAATLGPTTGERMRFFDACAAPLARRAATRAIEQAAVDPQDVTHLVTVCCTGFSAPGVDIDLIEGLGLRPTTQRLQIGYMGCHGAMNGLRCSQALTTADPAAVVLLCAVELCSLHYRFNWDPPRIVANALFGDGAAAVVGAGGVTSDQGEWTVAATASCVLPGSKDAMSWRIGDHGFEMTLEPTVPDLIRRHLQPWMAAWLAQHGLNLESVASWAIHPGGPRILHACAEALGLPADRVAVSEEVLAEYGNMSSPTVLFIVDRLRSRQAPLPCVSLAFGPGLTAEAALFR